MKLLLTMEFESEAELAAFMAATRDIRPTIPVIHSVPEVQMIGGSIAERPDRNVVPPTFEYPAEQQALEEAAEHLAPSTKVPTMPELEEAVKAYGQKHGFQEARKLLDQYTTGRVGSVPVEKHAELYGRLTA